MFSIAVKTLRPKKNDRPQSKAQFAPPALQSGPPKVLKAVLELLLLLNSVSAFSMLKLTDTGELMFMPWFPALQIVGRGGWAIPRILIAARRRHAWHTAIEKEQSIGTAVDEAGGIACSVEDGGDIPGVVVQLPGTA